MKFKFVKAIFLIVICAYFTVPIVGCRIKNKPKEQIVEAKIEVEYGEKTEEAEDINDVEDEDLEDVGDEDIIVIEGEYIEEVEQEQEVETDAETIKEEELVSLGQFTLTAYCSCVNCCGQYAYGRPVDENGNEIVHGAIGETLISGVSIAVDPYVIPFYTEVIINGQTYIAHDTGGLIKGNRIDVYFDNHEDACAFGLQYAEVFMKK